MLDVRNTLFDTKKFKYVFPQLKVIIHSILHITQGMSYMGSEKLLIPNSVLGIETPIHYLSWLYGFIYFSRNMNVLSIITGLNAISWILGFGLIDNYTSGNIHEYMSYFLTSVMGALNVYYVSDNKLYGYIYFIFSYIYLFVWLLFVSYENFVKYNHFMELLLTSILTMMTMMYVHLETKKRKRL